VPVDVLAGLDGLVHTMDHWENDDDTFQQDKQLQYHNELEELEYLLPNEDCQFL